jgi:hypothetical protein
MSDLFFEPQSAIGTENSISGAIWGNCPWNAIAEKVVPGQVFFEDFNGMNGGLATDLSPWDTLADNSGTAALTPSDTGTAVLTTGTTANNYVYLGSGSSLAGLGKIVLGSKLWFETRWKVGSITTSFYMVGLAKVDSTPMIAAGALTNTSGVLLNTNGSYLMHHVLGTTLTSLDTGYGTAGTAETVHVVGSAGLYRADGTTRLGTMVADTYVKTGYHFDGKFWWAYIDGKKVSETGVAYTATNFPDGANFHALFGIKTNTTSASTMTIDWVKCAYQAAL